MEPERQSEVVSNQAFRSHSQTPFAQSNYQYPAPSAPYPMDSAMSMEEFARGVQSATNAMRSRTPPSTMDGPRDNSTQVPVTPLVTPGMAPPQPGNAQTYSPTATRPSIDDNIDSALSGGDPKRKRSKVSRACDECRRKKVRCDAAADDGSLKTCSNCARSGNVCGYNRVPMKRGPSKGYVRSAECGIASDRNRYIKELSERVQQVESQMAMSNTPGMPGYRSSLDGSSGPYPEAVYSPDDQISFKRNFSFSDHRNLFTNPDFNKDRIPSASSIRTTSSPQVSGFRRDRGSVAIAPDQQSPTFQRNKPFWTASIGSEDGRPSKRQKIDSGDHPASAVLDPALVSKYYSNVHVNLPILPEIEEATSIFNKAGPEIQSAFHAALRMLPPILRSEDLSVNEGGPDSAHHMSYHELASFMWDAARENPAKRSRDENLVYLWTYLLMAVEAEIDLSRFRDGPLPRATIIKHTVDLGWRCIELENELDSSTGTDGTQRNHLARAWYAISTLARLHALSVGSQDPIPSLDDTALPVPQAVLPPSLLHSSQSSIVLATIIETALGNFDPNIFIRPNKKLRKTIRTLVRWGLATTNVDEAVEAKMRTFFDLLTSRHIMLFGAGDILMPAITMVDLLKEDINPTASNIPEKKHVYDPMMMHYYVLTTITLLEFIQQGLGNVLAREAFRALQDLKAALEGVVVQNVQSRKAQGGPQTSPKDTQMNVSENENVATRNNSSSTTGTTVETEWPTALINLIERRIEALGPDADAASVSHVSRPEHGSENGTAGNGITARDEGPVAVDFSMLLRHGYMNVLTASVGL